MTTVFTNGCFDILHKGHAELLRFCKNHSAISFSGLSIRPHVVVGLNSDASIKKLKGDSRPINSQEDRAFLLKSLKYVDEVIIFDEETPYELIKKVEPLSDAKYIEFETVYRPEEMPGQKRKIISFYVPWPYTEGLRLDEGLHPLTILSTGLYGHDLLNQNGAPLRLIVPWKYGFKSIKSIVAIRFLKEQPKTTWSSINPSEYGFYSNVNPNVDHPRWSQATERIIGEGIWTPRVKTLMFNGYGDEVANLYTGMDLKKYF
mgnify:CR=1 FL=1